MGTRNVGEIWVYETWNGIQLFFIHNVNNGIITTSGINLPNNFIYEKSDEWVVSRKASSEEEILFYKWIEEHGYKFNRNTGIE